MVQWTKAEPTKEQMEAEEKREDLERRVAALRLEVQLLTAERDALL